MSSNSTHTFLVGRDFSRTTFKRCLRNFNSHAPCGKQMRKNVPRGIFKSRRPFARHDFCRPVYEIWLSDFNSHAPCGARPYNLCKRVTPTQDTENILSDFSENTCFYAFFVIFSREPTCIFILLAVRVTQSARLPGHRFLLRLYAQFCSSSYCQDNISSDYLAPD